MMYGRNLNMLITNTKEMIEEEKMQITHSKLWGVYNSPQIFEEI